MSVRSGSADHSESRVPKRFTVAQGRLEPDGRRSRSIEENIGSTEAWLSVAAGSGLVWGAWQRWSLASLPLAVAGASLLYRGSTRHCPVYSAAGINHAKWRPGPDAVSMITINKLVGEVYSFWRDLRNAPRFMTLMDRVDVLDEKRSRWHTRELRGRSFEYEAEIVDDTANDGFRWRSVDGSPMEMRGAVRFKPAPDSRGTVVIASVIFGRDEHGSLRGRIASPLANYTIHQDLMRLKQLLETNEIPTTEGQPAGPPNGRKALRAAASDSTQTHDWSHGEGSYEYGASRS